MALYHYRALNAQGQVLQGDQVAHSSKEVLFALSKQNLDLLSVRRRWWIQSSSQTLSHFFLTLSYALQAGHTLTPALRMIEHSFHGFFRDVIKELHKRLSMGQFFSEACQEYPMIFSAPLIALIRVGEQSGKLAHICQQAHEHISQQVMVRSRFLKALTLPLVNFLCFFVALMVLNASLLPDVVSLLTERNIPFPWATCVLLSIKTVSWGKLGLYGLGLTGFGLLGLPWWGQLTFFLQGIMGVQRHAYAFLMTLHILLQEKIPLVVALSLSCESVKSSYARNHLSALIQEVQEGKKIYQVLQGFPHLPLLYKDFLQAGEGTGHLNEALKATIQLMKHQMNQRVELYIRWLSPCLLLMVGIFFGILIEGTLMPLYEHMGPASYRIS
jgi:general secretion pathway protein F